MKYSFILEIDDISKDDINELVNILSDNKIKFHVLKSDKELKENQKYIEELYISKNDITYPDGVINNDELVDCILEITSKINKLIKEVNKLRKEDK